MIGNRLIVDTAVYDDFVDRFLKRARALTVGHPSDPQTDLWPIINSSQLQSIQDRSPARDMTAHRCFWRASRWGRADRGSLPMYWPATTTSPPSREEVFGPVMTIVRADDEDDALRIANDTEYGLSSAVFNRDVDQAVRFARRSTPACHVNDSCQRRRQHRVRRCKASGIGRFGGHWAIDEFTIDHWVSVQRTPRDYGI